MSGPTSNPESPPGLVVVICGPSGVGKTTIAHAALERFDAVFSVSATTRQRSDQEVDGVDYDFVDEATFQQMVDDDAFLEYARVFGRDAYGTPRKSVEQAIHAGKVVILDIDVQGALQVRQRLPGALLILVLPPSDEELLRRLHDRGRDDGAAIQRRFAEAKTEINIAQTSGAFDTTITNADLDQTIKLFCDQIAQRLATV